MKPIGISRRGLTADGHRLRQLRQARGLTQIDLAKIAGISPRTLRTLRTAEAGGRGRIDFLRFIATALGVEVTDLAAHSKHFSQIKTPRDSNNHAVRRSPDSAPTLRAWRPPHRAETARLYSPAVPAGY